jgi:hypothetical protein
MILNQNIAASWSFNNDKEDITLSIYFMNAYECDAMLYRYGRTIGHDITSDADKS